MLITLAISIIILFRMLTVLEENISVYISKVVSNITQSVDGFLKEIDKYSMYILQDQEMIDKLNDINDNPQNAIKISSGIKAIVRNYKTPYFHTFKSIWVKPIKSESWIGVVESLDSLVPSRDPQLMGDLEIHGDKSSYGETVWTRGYDITPNDTSRNKDAINKSIFAVRKLKNLETFRNIGILVVELDIKQLKDLFEKTDNEGVIILNPLGELVYSTDNDYDNISLKEAIGLDNYQNILSSERDSFIVGDVLYAFDTSGFSDWKIICTFSIQNIYNDVNNMQHIIFIVSAIGIVFGIFMSIFISVRIEKPIRVLLDKMHVFESGDFDLKIKTDSKIRDIILLYKGMGHMVEKINELIKRIFEEKLREKELEIKILQMQINPHFLYNTLDAMHWRLVLDNQNTTADAVVALSSLLRFSISGTGITSLEQELNQLENYFTTQRLRYDNRFCITTDYDPLAMAYSVPKLTLQPLIENSINHGLKNYQGLLHIATKLEDDCVIIIIEDDGVGISEQMLMNISNQKDTSDKGSGIGIRNTSERIAHLMGVEDAVTITSKEGFGTRVEVKLPRKLYIAPPMYDNKTN